MAPSIEFESRKKLAWLAKQPPYETRAGCPTRPGWGVGRQIPEKSVLSLKVYPPSHTSHPDFPSLREAQEQSRFSLKSVGQGGTVRNPPENRGHLAPPPAGRVPGTPGRLAAAATTMPLGLSAHG